MLREPIGDGRTGGKVYVGLLIGLVTTALVLLLEIATWPDNLLELALLDFRLKHFSRMPASEDVVHLDIDEKSLEQLGRWPWPRRYLGYLISHCREAGAEQVVLDILLPEEQPKEIFIEGVTNVGAYEPPPQLVGEATPVEKDNDALLATAMKRAGSVALAFHAQLPTDRDRPELTPEQEEYRQLRTEVMTLLRSQDEVPTFAALHERIWPQKSILERDPGYYQLLHAYSFCRAQMALEKFALPIPDNGLPIPLRSMEGLAFPVPMFAEAIDNTGFATVIPDVDGVVRRMFLLARREGRLYKQLAFAVLCRRLGVSDDQIDLSELGKVVLRGHDIEIPVDENGMMLINWAGPWQNNPNHISVAYVGQIWEKERALTDNRNQLRQIDDLDFKLSTVPDDLTGLDAATIELIEQMRTRRAALGQGDVLRATNEQLQEEIAEYKAVLRERLAGKIVLVGSTSTGVPDFVVTPIGSRTPGVVVHGNIVDTILRREFIRRPPRWIEYVIIILLGAVITAITSGLRPLASGLAIGGMIFMTFVVNCVWGFQGDRMWFVLGSPLIVIVAGFTAVTFYRQVTEGREKRMVTRRFKQYAAPAVVDKIVRSGSTVRLEGEVREISCYFSDLSGFTTISERLGPQRSVAVLNVYLDRMTEVLHEHEATINKFEGDGVFAFFGAPLDVEGHARLACLAALESSVQLGRLVAEQQQADEGFPTLKMRVGISTGQAVVGDCGSHRRFDYTAIGDTVNLGARLESANKAFGSHLMICEHSQRQAAAAVETRYLGKVRVVGKKQDVGIYELMGRTGQVDDQRMEHAQMFAKAVRLFQQASFVEAVKVFQQCLKHRPDDKGTQLYVDTANRYIGEVPLDDFTGCIELVEK